MSQIRTRVEKRISDELDKTGIQDVPEGTAARSGIANPVATLAVSAYQDEVETWLRDWRTKTVDPHTGDVVDALLEDFRT